MGIMDSMMGKKPAKTSEHTILVLTQLGKAKSEKFDLPGAKWRILSILNESGPSSLRDITEEIGMDGEKAKAICRELITEGYIKKAEAV